MLAENGIPTEFWHTGGGYTALKVPVGSAEICITDVNGQVDEPLSDYHGLAVYYYPHFEHEGIRLYESPDIGTVRDPTRFDVESAAAIKVIRLCRQLCAARSSLTELDRWQRLAPPQPDRTLARFHRDVQGRTTLTVATTVRLAAEEIAATLACHYEVLREGDELPRALTRPELLDILVAHAQPCVHPTCVRRPGSWNAATPTARWAAAQVRSVLPTLSWKE
ncbi:hypothetical protein ACGF12_22585 [Kitasatospora sp. NPDC048296]|uniref:hypothetical protein n=1 Tax=Kitasatospora sp. NPDC048296 TaxID=3364048 RepID=UPI00371073BA